jgi:hypothetical protein
MQPNISLLEIMNALEASFVRPSLCSSQIGNPHMDTGLKPGSRKICDPGAALSSAEICWIMDEMTAQEAS